MGIGQGFLACLINGLGLGREMFKHEHEPDLSWPITEF